MKNFKHLAKATLSRNMDQLIKRRGFAASATTNALHDPSARVSGGDTVTHMSQTCCSKIRLAVIDTPELKWPLGREAKTLLASKVISKEMQALVTERCRYGRTISTLLLNTRDDKLAMLQKTIHGIA